jgi:hypothetical protein
LQHRPREAREEQPAHRHRRNDEQPQIVGEKERRQRRDDAAEGEKREERQEQPRQTEPQQVIAQLRVVPKLPRQPERAGEQRAEDTEADDAEQARAREIAALAPPRAIARGPQLRQQ